MLHFSATLSFSFSDIPETMPKRGAGGTAGCPAPRPRRLSAGAAGPPRRGAEPRAAPWPLRSPKPPLPTSFDSVFPTSEAHPGAGRAPHRSAKLRPSRRSLLGMGRPHLPHQRIEISTAANILRAKTHFLGCIQCRKFPRLQFQHLPLVCLTLAKPKAIRSIFHSWPEELPAPRCPVVPRQVSAPLLEEKRRRIHLIAALPTKWLAEG